MRRKNNESSWQRETGNATGEEEGLIKLSLCHLELSLMYQAMSSYQQGGQHFLISHGITQE